MMNLCTARARNLFALFYENLFKKTSNYYVMPMHKTIIVKNFNFCALYRTQFTGFLFKISREQIFMQRKI